MKSDAHSFFLLPSSERAARHCRELAKVASMPGHAATVIFTVQREDVRVDCGVRPSDFHDPAFAAAMRDAASKGVRETN